MGTGVEKINIQCMRDYAASSDVKSLEACMRKLFTEENYTAKSLLKLHDDLLYTAAYAPSNDVYSACKVALDLLTELVSGNEWQLQDSGIKNTRVVSSYTFPLVKWMSENYSSSVRFHSFDEEKRDAGEELKFILPQAEMEVLTYGWGKNKLFNKLCGGEISVEKILSVYNSCSDKKLRDYFFSKLGLYIELCLTGEMISRTTARSVDYAPYFHNEILKRIDHGEIISTSLPPPKRLNERLKYDLVATARMMLAALGRETDPVTTTASHETEFYVLGRGFSIALFSLDHNNRLPFDSYIGYMMFKNGLPVAYGGAWIFAQRALIGINIFDAYRGGESSYLFAELLRVYHQRYKVNRFSVEPYQYGKDNPEGISSGAYWFYYRFGFRSDDEKLRALAEEEYCKIQNQKSYRSPASVLKLFTKSNISLLLGNNHHGFDPGKFSMEITAHVAKEFGSDRAAAIKHGEKVLRELLGSPQKSQAGLLNQSSGKNPYYEAWCLAFLMLRPQRKLIVADKNLFWKMLYEKCSGSESEYIKCLQRFLKLF